MVCTIEGASACARKALLYQLVLHSLLSTIPLPRRQLSFRLSKGGCFLLAVRLAGHTTTKNMLSVSELCSRLSVDGIPMGC